MATIRGGVKDRIVHEIGRAIKQAQLEWCGVGCVRACTGRWLVLSLDAALLHGLRSLGRGYWPVVATLLDRPSLNTITSLPYATKPLARGRSWVCLCLNEGQLENYLHVLTSHPGLLASHYEAHGLLRDPHRAHLLLMLAAGLEHLKFAIPMDVPGWMQAEGSLGSSSGTSMNSMSLSMTSMSSSLPSPSVQDPLDLDTTCSEALEENWLSVEEEVPVAYPRCEDLEKAIHIEHIPKVSRRKRQSRSSSQNSSGGTTPITSTPVSAERKVGQQLHENTTDSLGGRANTLLDDRTEAPLSAGKNCDNCCKEDTNVARNKGTSKCHSRLVADNVQRQGPGEKTMPISNTQPSGVEAGKAKESKGEGPEDDCTRVEPKVVLRQNVSSKNSEKRVSFTDITEAEMNNKTMHKRLSLCSGSGRGMEIRDLSDLKELLSSLKVQGLLPVTLSLDELFSSFDQSSPVLSERAPPEGQEDPPLHQSITSLFHNNNNNNNSSSDDSNNNNASEPVTGEMSDSEQKSVLQERDMRVGCFSHHSDIIDGVRWEELTKIGQEMLKENCQENGKIGKEALISRIYQESGRGETQKATGTKPKRRQDYLNQTDIQTWRSSSKNSGLRKFPQRSSCYAKTHQHTSLADRKQLYKQLYREERRLPSLYIPAKVELSSFKEEEERLALEVAQGQSNLTLPGAQVDPLAKQRFTAHLFMSEEEKFYKMFSVREGHSSGESVGVQVVLSTHALYVVAPLPRGAKPRHSLKYSDIYTIIVGANDQWVCVMSREAMQKDLAATGTFPGVQLEVGDPDVTHSLMSSLELAIRRHFLSGKLGTRGVAVPHSVKDLKPSSRKGFLQEFTRECVDNFSNSLLEESLLNAWDTQKSVDISQATTESSEASPAVTPGSAHSSQESSDASQLSTDISDMSNDTSQSLTEASHTSGELSRASSDDSQALNDISHLSSDVILGSTDSSRHASDLSNSLSDETPTSSDMVQSLSSISDASLNMSQTSGHGEPESCESSQHSGGTIKDSDEAEQAHHPVELQLQKQNRFYSFAGGYSRWNGALLEQSLPAVVVHPSWELPSLSGWLRTKLRLQESPEVVGYWLVDWEDGSSLGGGDSVYGPLGPTKEGSLMFKPPGLLMPWRPAYFILKAGVLYQFNDARERLPHMIVEVVQCVGCVRLSSSQRPHAFQLLRKKDTPLMLAASDEHQASLWLQAFLTIINSGVRDISERMQVPCRVVLLESGVLLAQQSDLFLGSPPNPNPNSSDKDTPGNTSQQLLGSSPSTQPSPAQLATEKKDPDKPKNMLLSHLKERKPLSSSLTALNHVSGTSSVPGSPVRRISRGEKCLSPARRSLHLRQNSLSRLPDIQGGSERQHSTDKPSLPPPSPQRKLSVQHTPVEKGREEDITQLTESFRSTGEVKVLTISAMEHLSSVSIYAECPTTCLLEFECSEAGEISGDWALYFRSGGQLQQFVAALAHTWQLSSQVEFPLRRVEDAGVQQFLLEGSQISSNGWSLLHL